jgi:putative ABC transport system ATP-binding protein
LFDKEVFNLMTDKAHIDIRGLSKTYAAPSGSYPALQNVSLQVEQGEFVAVVGKSGSGNSTLLNVLTGIDEPSVGEVYVAQTPVHELNQKQLAVWRGKTVGVIFQFFQLLPTLTVAENVILPMDFCKTYPIRERRERALSLLDRVDIREQADKMPSSLSGGQQQRAAIARALANDPPVLVADEPTGNLDSQTSDAVLELFAGLSKDGKTIMMVTHERDVTRFIDRSIILSDGQVVQDGKVIQPGEHNYA